MSPAPRHSILLACVLAMALPQAASLRADPAGGTVDPASVNVRTVFDDFPSLDPNDSVYPVAIASDASGNYFTLTVLNENNHNANGGGGQFPPRTVLTKFDPNGNLLWRRERAVATVDGSGAAGFFETFSADQTPFPINGEEYGDFFAGQCLAVGPDGRVTMACQVSRPPYPDEGGASYINYTPLFLVSFDANGNFLWRDLLTGTGYPLLGYALLNSFQSLQSLPDGSVVALVDQLYPNFPGAAAVFKLDPAGQVTFAVNFGLTADDTGAFASLPVSISADAAGNLYAVSQDVPTSIFGPPVGEPLQPENVIRKFDGQGNLLGLVRSNVSEPATPGVADTWAAAQAGADGSVYIAGVYAQAASSSSAADGVSEQLVLKYDPSLTQVWRATGPNDVLAETAPGNATVNSLRLSASGITVGGSAGTASTYDGTFQWEIARYAYADGGLLWHTYYSSGLATNDFLGDNELAVIRLDSQENVFAGGIIPAGGTNAFQVVLGKFDAGGNLQFVKAAPSTGVEFQADSLSLFGNDRPLFFGTGFNGTLGSVTAVDFDNPADVTPAAGKLADVVGILPAPRVALPPGDGTTGKYKVKGSYLLSNLGRKPANNVAVSVYLSTNPTVGLPVAANDPNVVQLPMYLDNSDPAQPTLRLQLSAAPAPVMLAARLGKKGHADSSFGPISVVFKIPANRVTTGTTQYPYLLVVADPANEIKETNKTNNIVVVSLLENAK